MFDVVYLKMRLILLNSELNIEGEGGFDVTNDADERPETEPETNDNFDEYISDDDYEPEYTSNVYSRVASKSERPSLLDGIKARNTEASLPASGKQTQYDI